MAKGPGGAPFWVSVTPRDTKTWTFIEEMQKRREALMRMIPYAAAVQLRDGLLALIPKGAEYEEYRRLLKVGEVAGGKKGKESAFSVYAISKAKKVKKTDVGKTLIYVKANKSRNNPPDPGVKLLEELGPWTVDTIPFHPTKKQASVSQRKAPKEKVDRVRKQQNRDRPKTRKAMAKIGRTMSARNKGKGAIKGNLKAVADLAMLANSLEFGEGARRATPAWRKTLKEIKTLIKQLAKKEPNIMKAWTDPNDKRWRSWPQVENQISPATAAEFQEWQDKVG